MDPNVLHLVVAGVLTLIFVVITAIIWSRAQVKTVFWWIGLTLVPMAVYLLGLAPATAGAYETLRLWWDTLQFTPVVWVGLVLTGLAALLILGSRLIPSESYRDRRAALKEKKTRDAAGSTTRGAAAGARPAVGPGPGPDARPAAQPRPAASKGGSGDSEMDEIAELLRKRGIN